MQILDTENTLQATEFTGNQRIPGAAKETLQSHRFPLQETPGSEFWDCFKEFSASAVKN